MADSSMSIKPENAWIAAAPPELIAGDGFILARRYSDCYATRAFFAVVEESRAHLEAVIPWAVPKTAEAAGAYLKMHEDSWHTRDGFQYFIILPSDDASDPAYLPSAKGIVAGCTGLFSRRGKYVAEIGYWMGEKHTRKGLAKKSTALLTSYSLSETGMGAERVDIIHEKSIEASSGGVPRSLGFERCEEFPNTTRAPLPGETGILVRWQMTRDNWARMSSPSGK